MSYTTTWAYLIALALLEFPFLDQVGVKGKRPGPVHVPHRDGRVVSELADTTGDRLGSLGGQDEPRDMLLQETTTQTPQTFPTSATTTPPLALPSNLPWYLKELPEEDSDSFSKTKRNQSEISAMLAESDKIFHPFRRNSPNIYQFLFGKHSYTMMPTSEMGDMVSELALCSQVDVLTRISCRNRCGHLPDTRAFIAQCACDQDCFLYGDCCEDMNELCTDIFVQTVYKFYDVRENFSSPICHRDGAHVLVDFYKSEKIDPSVEPKTVRIDCDSEVSKQDAVNDIFEAFTNSSCGSKSLLMGQTKQARFCDRPDVLMCGNQDRPGAYTFFPIHLMCLENPTTQRLVERYGYGFHDMEMVSHHGNCSYLRLTENSNTAYSTNDSNAPRNLWRKNKLEKIKLTIVSTQQSAVFNFELRDMVNVRCTGGLTASDWRCEVNECFDGQMFDEKFKQCYWPDYAS
ncbi:hypothetical protein ElyMa_004571000, partial [Elysia marginata]